ncbi:bifunctional non-homologous end joining protein LigD [Paenibacillus shirakamiensis]|uniref:Bifunctional non-homologous end joining protein LigD n=1 Tax=Paenibacillus shirakamiensis TaxID=1265935 RepID=A0ABS4JF39_9BACL|nr:DNA ligase [Paenibacillus shirakamiensis]MBP2000317.1 bifunctional non-homologous end joining protein LigD [Paenibacillus shirakamiensis]
MIIPNFTPMSPRKQSTLPVGNEWIHQLKWDGYRIIASNMEGEVELLSKKMLSKNKPFPDLVAALSRSNVSFILDGEIVILDEATGQPSFQLLQQRDKLKDESSIGRAAERLPVVYVVFDLLMIHGEDIRKLPYHHRREQLLALASEWGSPIYIADEFEDGSLLWKWVIDHGWEGIVSKKKCSRYREGKEHHDWVKCKTVAHYDASVVGIIWKEGRISSLVMKKNEQYFGRISSGLTTGSKQALSALRTEAPMNKHFDNLPEGLKGAEIRWLNQPLAARVTGRELTEAGILRHPKLIDVEGISL